MALGQRVDPYRNYNFLVEIDGITQAGFTDVSGLGSSIEVVEYREGGFEMTAHKLPGMTKYNNIVLKWGLTDSDELYKWHANASKGKIERKNGSIIVLDLQGQEKARWNFYNAWPSKWDGPTLSAKGNEIAIDSLELTHERVERVS